MPVLDVTSWPILQALSFNHLQCNFRMAATKILNALLFAGAASAQYPPSNGGYGYGGYGGYGHGHGYPTPTQSGKPAESSATYQGTGPYAAGVPINYTSVPGYFLQDDPSTNASTFDYV